MRARYGTQHVVYALVDPTFGELRYVGYTNNLRARLSQHRSGPLGRTRRDTWLASLGVGRKYLRAVILQIVTSREEGFRCERLWMDLLNKTGSPLVNSNVPTGTITQEMALAAE